MTATEGLQTTLGALTSAIGGTALYAQAQTTGVEPGDWVSFSGPAMLVVSGLLSVMSGVVTFQARALDKERERGLSGVLDRLKDRDATIADQKSQIMALQSRVEAKDEQIFRLLGLSETATSALDALAPLARRTRLAPRASE